LNIFDIIDGIAFSKKQNIFDTPEAEKEYQPFIVNRWLSMLDPIAAKIVNLTVNKTNKGLESPRDQYNMLMNVLPTFRRQRINYIKRPKTKES
jgi:hypothetical protein